MSSKVVRKRKGTQYFITIPIEVVEDSRNVALENLTNFCCKIQDQEIIEYCISLENYKTSEKFNYHLHIFVEYKIPFFIDSLKNFLSSKYISNVDCKPCRSKKSILKYITKCDTSPLFNCSPSKFHFNYRIYEWASNTDVFDIQDDFVVDHRQHFTFLKNILNLHNEKKYLRIKNLI